MTATIISNTPPFGAMTNKTVAALHEVNIGIARLAEAVATAASGYEGTAGAEYEGDGTNFGVVAGDEPGEKGSDYAYAVNNLAAAWATFWQAALPSIQQIDNGVTLP
ncbi:MAG TPA: hypothetical protein VFW22_07860 [Pseudolabrys sp.]|nr:hypothetical protein [Pseudolabrys sp.]